MRVTDKEDAHPEGQVPSRALPAQPAFTPASWASRGTPPANTVLTPGQPVAPAAPAPPVSFSFGEVTTAPPSGTPSDPLPAPLPEILPVAGAETEPFPQPAPPAPELPLLTGPEASPAAPAPASSLAITTTGPDPQQLERELAAAQEELRALHEMLEDLPEIFERKFQQRLATVMEHQKHLLADNHALRERLYSLNPAAAAEAAGTPRNPPVLVPTVTRPTGWGEALRRALRLGGSGRSAEAQAAARRRSVATTTGGP